MPKLPVLSPEKLARALEKKGFVLDRIRGSHHVYCHPDLDVTVTIPFHKKEVGKGLLIEIIKQAEISREELLDLL
ncbi:type II toxin-antitoxin system HicA family toxin [Methanothrix sp.]|jgi:predicted RNA binding protein YcfA (HicA-like mRNA interferase family)|uniref:type II toxin-antitoxin system HicA family toxin n=1 Tax=Methanothrix sp. TaxID=90426 RepID=UPI0025FF90E2|nr:type II toxin-antitoxin system HicA family toxin [Methanothrix sp.]MCK9406760.1 type II toxin-antitoxin system HicA family toxin [Methanothrix sp.]